jgi:hypothetical protein
MTEPESRLCRKRAPSIIDQLQSDPFFQFHRNYWQFNEKEKAVSTFALYTLRLKIELEESMNNQRR